MWFDRENREEKDMILISLEVLNNIKTELRNSVNKIGMGDTYIKHKVVDGQIEIIDKIIEKAHLEMKDIKHNTYISLKSEITEPYIEGLTIGRECEWNRKYHENAECECGDPYYRHFDTYENMEAIGCKYCGCRYFKPKIQS